MTEIRIPASRFAFDPLSQVKNTTRRKRSFESKQAAGEKPILAMLEKYGMMNLHMVREGLVVGRHKRINAQKSLRLMQEAGLVEKYTILASHPDLPDNDVYVLSRTQRETCGIAKAVTPVHDYNMANILMVLEKLTLCQWHLQMLKHMDGREVFFNHRAETPQGMVLVPSLVKVKTRLKRPMYLCAVPVAKGRKKEAVTAFLAQVAFLTSYFALHRRRFPSCVLVLLAESEEQIGDVARLLSLVTQTADLYVLYAIDSLVADEEVNPLQMLYQVRRTKNAVRLDLVKLI